MDLTWHAALLPPPSYFHFPITASFSATCCLPMAAPWGTSSGLDNTMTAGTGEGRWREKKRKEGVGEGRKLLNSLGLFSVCFSIFLNNFLIQRICIMMFTQPGRLPPCCRYFVQIHCKSIWKGHSKTRSTTEGKHLGFSPNPETTDLCLIPHPSDLLMYWSGLHSSLSRWKMGLERFSGANDSQLVWNRAGICSQGSYHSQRYPLHLVQTVEKVLSKGTNDW